jgi:hypothetical protein
VPVLDAIKFKSQLENAVSGSTFPPHKLVVHEAILSGAGPEGFVVTHVPSSFDLPIQSVRDWKFYVRTGSNFGPVPYAVLAGMFGRRPQPHLFLKVLIESVELSPEKLRFRLALSVRNEGPGVSNAPYFTFVELQMPNASSTFVLSGEPSHDLRRLVPHAERLVNALDVRLVMPATQAFVMDICFGCEQSPVKRAIFRQDKDTLQAKMKDNFDLFARYPDNKPLGQNLGNEIVAMLLGHPQDVVIERR